MLPIRDFQEHSSKRGLQEAGLSTGSPTLAMFSVAGVESGCRNHSVGWCCAITSIIYSNAPNGTISSSSSSSIAIVVVVVVVLLILILKSSLHSEITRWPTFQKIVVVLLHRMLLASQQ